MVAWVADYARAREREGRTYPDEIVRRLPGVPPDHPLAAEWRLRAHSSGLLLRRLRARGARRIVDLGCGNGWLTAAMSALPGANVVGVDANLPEVEQARRVFREGAHLRFVEGDIEALGVMLPLARPDAIVLASTIQYVGDLPGLLRRLLATLADGGEVHVLDSPIYLPDEAVSAAERTRRHYEAVGVPALGGVYRHRTWPEVLPFGPAILHDPRGLGNRVARRLGRPRSPFPWLAFQSGGAR